MSSVDFTDLGYALLLAIVLVFGVKYISAIFQAWAGGANERQYRALAERAVSAQAESQATMVAMQVELSKLSSSLAAIEKILQQVE